MYSVDGIQGRGVRSAERRLAAELAEKWARPYSQMVHNVKVRMIIAVVRVNTLLIRGSRNRGHTHPRINSGPALLTLQEGQVE